MAVVFSNNATTVLSSNITNSATSIAVQDGSVFPTLSGTDYFYATLQDPGNTKREIVKVTARSGNTLTVTRAVDGSSASAFSANDAFELRLNAAALNDAVNSGTADLELNSFTGDGSEVDFTLSMEALEANTLVYIDGVYQNKTAYSISGYVLTFSAAPDNGAAIEVTTATVAPIQESTDFLLNQFTGDGSDTTFTLSSSPEENQTTVFISGVYQSKSNYSISGTTLTFSTAPPASSSIEVMVARTVVYGIGTPSNDTVSTAKIVDGAVTPAKLSLTYATETFVGTAVSNLVDSSPAALDTLNELAAALGDDPNFATTVTNSIALKAPLASPSFTGNLTMASGGSIVAGGVNDLILNAGESGTPDIYLQSGGSTKVKIEGSNGSVGIGASSPSKGLHLNFSNDLAAIRFQNTANAKVWDLTPSIPGVANSGFSLHNVTDNTVPLHVDNSGDVGIGTSSPSTKLHLGGTAPLDSIIRQDSTVSGTNWEIGERAAGKWQIWEDDSDSVVATFMSSGNVGIKETAPFGKLHISDTQTGRTVADSVGNLLVLEDDENGMSILSSNAGAGYILFGDTASASSGGIVYDHSANKFNFRTNNAWNRMILDASGNLLVGKTVNDNSTVGGSIRAGESTFTALNSRALTVGRSTNSGDLIQFRLGTGTVGSIGTSSSAIFTATGDTGLLFYDGGNAILPFTTSLNTRDNAIDLGRSSTRFKDLYLGGGVHLGGTGVANKLDDYEEGTWTPVLSKNSSPPSVTHHSQSGTYTKIGRMVYVSCYLNWTAQSGGTGSFIIQGLPFTILNSSGAYPQMVCTDYAGVVFAANDIGFGGYGILNNTSILLLASKNNGASSSQISALATSGFMYFNLTYQEA